MTYDDDYRLHVLLDFGGVTADDAPATFEITGDSEATRATLLNVQLGGLPLSRDQVETAIGSADLSAIESDALARWDELHGGYLSEYRGWGDAA